MTKKYYDLPQLFDHPLTIQDVASGIKNAEAALARGNLRCVSVRFDQRIDLSGAPWQMLTRAEKNPRRRSK